MMYMFGYVEKCRMVLWTTYCMEHLRKEEYSRLNTTRFLECKSDRAGLPSLGWDGTVLHKCGPGICSRGYTASGVVWSLAVLESILDFSIQGQVGTQWGDVSYGSRPRPYAVAGARRAGP
jgi:hypothetical protein